MRLLVLVWPLALRDASVKPLLWVGFIFRVTVCCCAAVFLRICCCVAGALQVIPYMKPVYYEYTRGFALVSVQENILSCRDDGTRECSMA